MKISSAVLATIGSAVGGFLLVPGTAHATAPAECTARMLQASFHATDAAMSHRFGQMRLTNVSTRTCWVQGYDGLSFVKHRGGTQVGAPAARTPSPRPRVVLAPRASAVSEVSITTTGPYDPRTCQPTAVAGFRVFVPDSRTSTFVRFATTTCANPALRMLEHQAYRRG